MIQIYLDSGSCDGGTSSQMDEKDEVRETVGRACLTGRSLLVVSWIPRPDWETKRTTSEMQDR